MPKSMPREVGNDFSASSTKYLFEELFQSAHDHTVRTSFPTSREGSVGDMVIVNSGGVYVCVKTSSGWYKSAAFTAI